VLAGVQYAIAMFAKRRAVGAPAAR
jgi:hypothetical protein